MNITMLWNIILVSTMLIAFVGSIGQFWYVRRCHRSNVAVYWTGIKMSNGVVLLFVSILCGLSVFDVPISGLFFRLAVFMLVFNLSAGGMISIVRVLRNRSRMGDPCD